jgi:hypothetical protein
MAGDTSMGDVGDTGDVTVGVASSDLGFLKPSNNFINPAKAPSAGFGAIAAGKTLEG